MHDIARNLKCLRRQRGLTQEELAARLHVTRQAVSNWERNRNLPELEILLSAAELLGVGVDELLYGPRPAEGAAAPANRRRRTVTAGALWAVWAALWLAYQLWALPALEAMYDKYDYSAAGWLLLWPALNLLLGMAVCALVSIWRELRPRRLALRRALFWAGAGCAALLFWACCCCLCTGPLWPFMSPPSLICSAGV